VAERFKAPVLKISPRDYAWYHMIPQRQEIHANFGPLSSLPALCYHRFPRRSVAIPVASGS